MEYYFDNERPIYLQLMEMLKTEIVSGRLKSGEKLPSVREFAVAAKVNPNTMQKALTELERDGLIYTERTNGKYVTDDTALISKVRDALARELVTDFVKGMERIGLSKDEIEDYILKERND